MAEAPDGIFDMVRAICTLSGMKVVFDTLYMAWEELYKDPCPRCFGAGTMTCQHCKGTKTLRARPQRLVEDPFGDKLLLHLAQDVNECWQCGPASKLDFDLENDDINEESASLQIMENFSAALSGRWMPHQFEPLAGTVPCDLCMGTRVMHRHTPNFDKVFGLSDDLWTQIGRRVGVPTYADTDMSVFKPRRVRAFVEYPKHAPKLPLEFWDTYPRRVHPILFPLDDVEPEDRGKTVDVDETRNPFKFILPQLDMKPDLPVGSKLAFP